MRKGLMLVLSAASLGLAACQHPDGSLDVGNTLLLGASVAAVAGVAASQNSYQPVGWGYGHHGWHQPHHGWHRPHHGWHKPHHGWHRPHHGWHRPHHWHGGGWHHGWRQHHYHWRGW
jgi:hypothetical protein